MNLWNVRLICENNRNIRYNSFLILDSSLHLILEYSFKFQKISSINVHSLFRKFQTFNGAQFKLKPLTSYITLRVYMKRASSFFKCEFRIGFNRIWKLRVKSLLQYLTIDKLLWLLDLEPTIVILFKHLPHLISL